MTRATLHRAVLEQSAVLEERVHRASASPVFAATHTQVADRNVLRTPTVLHLEHASARIAATLAKAPAVLGRTAKPSTIYHFVLVHLELEETPLKDAMSSRHVCISIMYNNRFDLNWCKNLEYEMRFLYFSAAPPCSPSPCGPSSLCSVTNGYAVCSCPSGTSGDAATTGCRPECIVSSECSRDRACVRNKCVDPCVGACGTNAMCRVFDHAPICSCPPETAGNPFHDCVHRGLFNRQ